SSIHLKVHADLILQIGHLPAQRRLSDSQPRRRFGEVQRFRRCHKISQMPQFHRSRALCRKGIATQATWYWADSSRWGKMGSDDQQGHVNTITSGENNHESDTNSSIRRTRRSGASGNAASDTWSE